MKRIKAVLEIYLLSIILSAGIIMAVIAANSEVPIKGLFYWLFSASLFAGVLVAVFDNSEKVE